MDPVEILREWARACERSDGEARRTAALRLSVYLQTGGLAPEVGMADGTIGEIIGVWPDGCQMIASTAHGVEAVLWTDYSPLD